MRKLISIAMLIMGIGSAQAQLVLPSSSASSGGGSSTPCTTIASSLQYNNAGAFGCVGSYYDGVQKIAIGNSATPQSFLVYNTVDTISSPTNYERGVFDWNVTSNVLTIGTQASGSGTNRDVNFVSANSRFHFTDGANFYSGPTTAGPVFVFNPGDSNDVIRFAGGLGIGTSLGASQVVVQSVATGVAGFALSNGSVGSGWLNWGGEARTTTTTTITSNTTLASVQTLVATLQNNRTYMFEAYLPVTSGGTWGGIKAAMSYAVASATNFIYDGLTFDNNAIGGQAQATTSGTAVGATTMVANTGYLNIHGTITVGAAGAGPLAVEVAQNASSATSTTIGSGAWLRVDDQP
jgi:hypothetical protein